LTELAEMCDLVGIIEQGRLLAVGNVAEIQRSSAALQSTPMQARVLGGAESLAPWLAARQDIQEVRTEGELAMFEHCGDREAEARLLRDMIEAGFRIVAFGSQTRSLEEVFMHVTRGHVQ
jgi:ABC-2 type transport system ATP-binding protein